MQNIPKAHKAVMESYLLSLAIEVAAVDPEAVRAMGAEPSTL